MKKQFYSHLTEIHLVEQELDTLDLSSKEKEELLHHVYSSIHYSVLDITLSSLPEEHKKTFIEQVNHDNYEKIWEHLEKNAVGIEEKIKSSASNVISEFLKDIRQVKSKA